SLRPKRPPLVMLYGHLADSFPSASLRTPVHRTGLKRPPLVTLYAHLADSFPSRLRSGCGSPGLPHRTGRSDLRQGASELEGHLDLAAEIKEFLNRLHEPI